MAIVDDLGGGIAAVLIVKHLHGSIDGLAALDDGMLVGGIADEFRAATLCDAVARFDFRINCVSFLAICFLFFIQVLFCFRITCLLQYTFFTFYFVVYFVAFIGLHIVYMVYIYMYIVNRKETLQLVHLLQFYQGGKAISDTRQMGDRLGESY